MSKDNTKGRPKTYKSNTVVRVAPDGSSKLQHQSDRRAIVDFLLDCGGVATLGEIDAYFEMEMRDKVVALVRAGWLETGKKKKAKK